MYHNALKISLVLILLACLQALANGEEDKGSPQPIRLSLTPAGEPSPALKHRLLPPYLQRHPGNAAPIYLKAFLVLSNANIDENSWKEIAQWLNAPPEDLPQEEARELLKQFAPAYRELTLAATSDHCLWDLAERERGTEIFATLLPEVQQSRSAARLLALKARLEVVSGEYEQALQTLQVGFALARHVAQQPFLVSGLVGVAIASQMTDQVEVFIDAPDSPNLYWAMASMPRPLIDPQPALDLEGSTLFLMFPELRDLENQDRTVHQWRQLWRSLFLRIGRLVGGMGADEKQGEAQRLARIAMADAMVEIRFPTAKKHLLARGYKEATVEKMARAQVVLLSEVSTFRELRDEMFKWSHLPYWRARDGMARVNKRMKERAKERLDQKLQDASIADQLLPAVAAAVEGFYLADQRLAALQTVEAVRMYSASHEGKLPRTLDQIVQAPIPVNPYTGKPASYRLDEKNHTARLTVYAPREDRVRVYELSIAK